MIKALKPFACQIAASLILSFLSSLSSDLWAEEIEYDVLDGKLTVFGYMLDPKYPIPGADSEDRFITFRQSPNKKWIVIQSGYRIKVDLWLYNNETKAKPVRIASQPGNHTAVNWYGSKVFEIFWGGMGYSMSQLFQVEDPQIGQQIDDMLLYDYRRDVYVSFFVDDSYSSGIEIGRAFYEPKLKPERFKLNLEYTYVSDARFAINDVRIIRNRVAVTHTKMNGVKVVETFSARALQ